MTRDASKTALGVCALRAVHQLVDGFPKILDDPIAAQLLDADVRERIRGHAGEALDPRAAGLRSHVVLRSRYTEDHLAAAAGRGVRQYAILGAGFDTFAYRQPAWARDLRIWEVDHPASQHEKRRRLEVAGLALPPNLELVPIDFETTSLRDGLRASSLDFTSPAFFACLGVLVYLTRDAARAIFELVASFPPGSEIAFTFSLPTSADSDLAEKARSLGEPWLTHFDPPSLTRELQDLGFAEVSILDLEEAARTYYADRTDGLQPPRRGGIASAVVGRSR